MNAQVSSSTPASRPPATPGAAGHCRHCGAEGPTPFCCAGCATVHALLEGAELGEYYAFRQRLGVQGTPSPEETRPDARFDAPAFARLYCRDEGQGRRSTELSLDGLHCAACVWLLERTPRLLPGLREVRVDYGRARVHVIWEPATVALSHVTQLFARLGYTAHEAHGLGPERQRARELRGLLVRIAVAGASAGNVMLLSFALYGAGRGAEAMDPGLRTFFRVASLVASLPALWAATPFLRGAWAALRTRVAHMDLPIGIGLVAAFVHGVGSTATGRGEAYFDSITTLIFLLSIGRWLTRRHQLSAVEAQELLHTVVPAWAVRAPDEQATTGERVAVDELARDELVLLDSGQVSPIDGVIVRGSSALDTSWLNGEPLPRWAGPGHEVEAGSVNSGAQLLLRVRRPARETRLASLIQDVERALLERSPLATLADRVAGHFTWVVLGLAGLTFALHRSAGVEVALEHALALLIVACPCALAMATPLALHVAVRQAARRDILFLRGEALERLARPCTVLLDKTGTLTLGRPTLLRWDGEPSWLDVARAVERHSHHPLARALLEGADGELPQVEDVRERMGLGVTALYEAQPVLVGSESFVRELARFDASSEAWLAAGPPGASPLVVAWAGRVRAIGWLSDSARPGVVEALRELDRRGHELILASGDHPDAVFALARELSTRAGRPRLFAAVHGGATPEDKRLLVMRRRAAGRPVVVVGDGVNDAAALAAADVGIAVHGAAEAARLSADVYLGRNGALDLVPLFEGSRRGLAVVRRGMIFSLLYNVLGIGAALLGWLHPLVAAVLMPLSSISVVSNAFRSRIFTAPSGPEKP